MPAYKRLGWIGAALLLPFVACGRLDAAEVTRPPNIVMIVVETLRYDHVNCLGYERKTTPAIDALATQGALFRQHVSSSCWTMPSVMSIMTSQPPARHGAVSYQPRTLASGITTLAAELGRQGYLTAGIVSNPTLNGKFGFREGFDLYDDFTLAGSAPIDPLTPGCEPSAGDKQPTGGEVTRLAVSWLTARKADPAKPFFLFLFYLDPHYDYLPPAPYDRMFTDRGYAGAQKGSGIKGLESRGLSAADKAQIVALYDGEVRYTDDQIGRLLQSIKQLGLEEGTITMLTGDHGEEFWEHGGTAHGHTLYDELLRIPLVIRYPGHVKASCRIETQTGHIDLMPTLLDLAGLPPCGQCTGRSLVPLMNGGTNELPLLVESDIEGWVRALRTSALKIVEHTGRAAPELYCLTDDPHELHNLAGTPRAAEFHSLLATLQALPPHVREGAAATGSSNVATNLDANILRQLRSLGYVR
jgi:arylsulfatase A-like enzyme